MLRDLRLDDNAPWKERFRAPVVLWTRLAREAPARGVAGSNKSGVYQLYAWDVPSGELRQLTHIPEGKGFGTISPDGRYVYYLHDEQGNELGHFVRIPFEGGEVDDITPDLPPYASFDLFFSQATNRLGFTLADKQGFHSYYANLEPGGALGPLHMLYETQSMTWGPLFSYDGAISVITTTERSGSLHFNILAIETASGQQIGELWEGEGNSVEPAMFSPRPGDSRLLVVTTRTGFRRPFIWDPLTGERTEFVLDGLVGEIFPTDWSVDGERILLRQFNQAVQHLYVYDLPGQSLTRLNHPGGTFGDVYFSPEDEIFAQWEDSTHPPQLIALDSQTGAQRGVILGAGQVPPGRSLKSITFSSSDGQAIQAWLATPAGEGPFPTILHTHGGPTSVMTEAFDPICQAWLDHGFAFVTVNYRGSTTFGRDFQDKILGDLGHWELEDMVAARSWLVENGVADPERILLMGWSYGGYLTLFGLGKRPDLWAGGLAAIAITDWAMMYEDSADTLKGVQRAIFGGAPEEKREAYRTSSPITYVEQVSAPVLIIQGRNDTRTTPRPIEMYEAKMKALGKPIEVVWFETGHMGSFLEVEQGIEHQEIMLRFAYRILK